MNDTLHGLVEHKLRRASQRYTQGRRQLVEVLAGAGHPVSIEDIGERAPGLPRSSAYRNLVDLEQAGIVRRVATNEEYSHYELAEDITEHHHHLVCNHCGRVVDVTPPAGFESAMAGYLDAVSAASGFRATDHRLDVFGMCAGCHEVGS
jgi:Fur family ferric uptake transcriptional regulator